MIALIPFYLKYLNMCCIGKMVLEKINPVNEGLLFLQIICWVSAFTGA